ncbi:hypothetical protein CJ030_MR2G018476 [Morella rubra]|uniref:Uncharacterized protein n=1 Tax=Morella rubra TaxID=262757 RepID=A0A6A1W9N9_9ROSI|nr:hypothetical protein CJ030_MR2G018476 [Morella rubra]
MAAYERAHGELKEPEVLEESFDITTPQGGEAAMVPKAQQGGVSCGTWFIAQTEVRRTRLIAKPEMQIPRLIAQTKMRRTSADNARLIPKCGIT